jgi:hypothetical protein
MPNWCSNHLACSGPRAAVTSFLGVVTQRGTFVSEVLTAAENIDPAHAGSITRAVLESFSGNENFSFNGHIPEPSLEGEGWYDWRITNWGTKWDANNPVLEQLELNDEGLSTAVFSFETAWGPPNVWLEKVAQTHPDLDFRMFWNEEQGYGGLFVSTDGDLLHQDMEWKELMAAWPDAPYAPYGEREDEEDSDEEDSDEEDSDDNTTAAPATQPLTTLVMRPVLGPPSGIPL